MATATASPYILPGGGYATTMPAPAQSAYTVNQPGGTAASGATTTSTTGAPALTSGQVNPADISMTNGGTATPTAPGFIQDYDPASQSLLGGYTNYTDANEAGLKALTDQALSKGPSAWANLADQQQDAQAEAQRDLGAQSVAGQTAGAMDNLAMQGGLSSGARERAQEGGANNLMAMDQNVGRQEGLNKLQVGINDQQNKLQQLGQLPGLENQQAQNWEGVRQTDLANETAENQQQNAYNQNLYNQQMQAWGAEQQANATANAGKK